jgi:hypothetical protein
VNNSWFYILHGQRIGPIAQDDLIAMHRSGTIDDDTLVWTPNAGQGQMGWRPYSEVGLNAVATSEGPVGPPPAPLSQISNKYVWLIVFAPIFLAAVELIEFVLSDGVPRQGTVYATGFAIYLALGFLDAREIERAGHLDKANRLSVWWIFLVPIYV